MTQPDTLDLDQLVYAGAVKLEITGGIPTWEVSPSSRHQRMVFRIQTSIEPIPGSVKWLQHEEEVAANEWS